MELEFCCAAVSICLQIIGLHRKALSPAGRKFGFGLHGSLESFFLVHVLDSDLNSKSDSVQIDSQLCGHFPTLKGQKLLTGTSLKHCRKHASTDATLFWFNTTLKFSILKITYMYIHCNANRYEEQKAII